MPSATAAPVEREILTAMIQHPEFAATACTLIPAAAFSDTQYRVIFECIDAIIANGQSFDVAQIVFEDEPMMALVAELALREMLPLTPEQYPSLIDHLLEAYEHQLASPAEIQLERAKVDSFVSIQKRRSDRKKQREYIDDDKTGPSPDEATTMDDPRILKHIHKS
jgi:hypothetical protein